MKPPARLKAVPKVPVPEPAPDTSYEWRQRQRSAAKDWGSLHARGPEHDFKGSALEPIIDRLRRWWRKS